MSNKSLGSRFENELCAILAAKGFWAYNTVNKAAGQPADIIAAVRNTPLLIDCKVCSNDIFTAKRIEENQKNAMFLFDKCGNGYCYFAMKFSDNSIYMVPGLVLIMLMQDRKSIDKKTLSEFGAPINEWMEEFLCRL